MKRDRAPQKNQIYFRPSAQAGPEIPEARGGGHGKLPLIAKLAIAQFFLFWASLLLIVPYKQWHFTPAWIFECVSTRFQQLYLFLFGENSAMGATFWQYVAVMLVGASLAACGAVFQSSLRNVLAGPSTMGVMSGGTLGCLIYLLLLADNTAAFAQHWWGDYLRQGSILAGCFLGVALVMGVSMLAGGGRLSTSAMILSGSVFSTLVQSLSMVIQYYIILKDPTDTRVEEIQDLMMGSFNDVTTGRTILLMAVPIVLCLALLLALRGKLELLGLGEEAETMGVPVARYRNLTILLGTVLTAVVVAFCGRLGFLGFMIPLVGRKLVGPGLRKLLPVSLLIGSILLTVVFDVAYICGLTDYLNLFTSSIGCTVMLVTLLCRKGGQGNDAFPGRTPARMG
jgi:iron complex transport system permease protein